MRAKEKANELANKFISKSVFDMTNEELHEQRKNAKKFALICVDEIVDSLKVTTGHLTLNGLDFHEVETDLNFWSKVKEFIEELGD